MRSSTQALYTHPIVGPWLVTSSTQAWRNRPDEVTHSVYVIAQRSVLPTGILLQSELTLAGRVGCHNADKFFLIDHFGQQRRRAGRRLFAVGPGVCHFDLGGKITLARIPFPQGATHMSSVLRCS